MILDTPCQTPCVYDIQAFNVESKELCIWEPTRGKMGRGLGLSQNAVSIARKSFSVISTTIWHEAFINKYDGFFKMFSIPSTFQFETAINVFKNPP